MANHTFYEVYDNNKHVGIFFSLQEIKDFLGISRNSISKIIKGNSYIYEGTSRVRREYVDSST